MIIEYGKPETEKAILIGLALDSRRRQEVAYSLEELARLATSAGAVVIGERIQVRKKPDPAFYIGRGVVKELKERLEQLGGNTIIFDDILSPAQQRNLEKELDVKVIDRPILILDIFATRARTRPARLQVELAQLEYMLPRLTGAWVHFSRQYGGIGAKGPGETQLEIDRRQIRQRISHLKTRLKKLDRQRSVQRKQRQSMFKVALVGYTNAGKSTLFNRLTKSVVSTADRLFTTLDSTTRVMSTSHPCRIIISDNVGFIKKLPHHLIESFKSTLEEVCLADYLLLLVDCGQADLEERISHTRQVLTEIGANNIPYMLIFNKTDTNPEFVPPLNDGIESRSISALDNQGLDTLQAHLITRAQQHFS